MLFYFLFLFKSTFTVSRLRTSHQSKAVSFCLYEIIFFVVVFVFFCLLVVCGFFFFLIHTYRFLSPHSYSSTFFFFKFLWTHNFFQCGEIWLFECTLKCMLLVPAFLFLSWLSIIRAWVFFLKVLRGFYCSD